MSIINLQDLEKLTSKLYGPLQDPSMIENANRIKEAFLENFENFPQLIEYLIISKNQHCQFWILDLLILILNAKYTNYFNTENKEKFREAILYILSNYIEKISSVNFIENKLCVLMIDLIKHDYPENCPNFFEILISRIFKTENENIKMLKVNFFINLLLTFDDELIKFRHTFNDYDLVRSTLIKDHMRTGEINSVIYVLNLIIQNHAQMNKKLVKNTIKAVSQLIDWNLINLFSEIINLVKDSLINILDYQSECLELINALINKGMELNQKCDLIKYLNVINLIEGILKKETFSSNENILIVICEIVTNIGNIVIECFELVKGLTKGEYVSNGIVYTPDQQQDLFNYICEVANYCLYFTTLVIKFSFKIDLKIALHLGDFISNIISYFKSNPFLAETLSTMLKSLVETIENSLIIPKSYNIRHELLSIQEDDDFFTIRKDYSNLYQSCFGIPVMKEFIYFSVLRKLEKISNGDFDLFQIEHTLHIINNTFQNINYSNLQNSDENLNKILFYLFSINFVALDSDNILLLYFETISRYLQYILNNDSVLIQVTNLYLSKRGIMNENSIVGARICNSFDKFIEKTKTQLGKMDLIYDISECIKNFLKFLVSENKNFQLIIEYNILFRTLSVTILQKHFSDEKRQLLYKEVCGIFTMIFLNFGLNEDIFTEACKCITNFLKCFGSELTPSTKIIFVDFINDFYQNVYLKLTQNSKVNYSMITILQRLIPILGKDSLQYVGYFLTNQIKFPDLDLYEDSCKLLQNTSQLLKKDSKSLVGDCFYLFYTTIKTLRLPESNVSEFDKNILSIYANFVRLMANICTDIVEILFEEGSLKNVNVEELINYMIFIGLDVIDYNIKRSVVKCLKSISIYVSNLLTQTTSKIDESLSQNLLRLVQNILNGSFRIYTRLNPTDNIDFNVFI